MGFSAEDMAERFEEVTVAQAAAYLQQWDERYTDVFSPTQARRHMRALATLKRSNPVAVLVDANAAGMTSVTILAHDYQGLFALLTGVLGAAGLNIVSGDVFTSQRVGDDRDEGRRARRRKRSVKPRKRTIIDRFQGHLSPGEAAADWGADMTQRLRQILALLEQGGTETSAQARHLVHEDVARCMEKQAWTPAAVFFPVEMDIVNTGLFTRLLVRSQDTPFFLYSLATALALRSIRIERVAISTTESGQVADVIDVLDGHGRKIEAHEQLDELRFSVALTKQFTYCLATAPDPYAALSRFETLTEEIFHDPARGRWLDQLGHPGAMQSLARILGASDFIWEDFIHSQYEMLLPLLQHREGSSRQEDFSRDALQARLQETLRSCTRVEEKREALNEWKDREIFRIDLHHIWAADADVRHLAEPLTTLAEVVVEAAAELACQELVRRYGEPRTVGGMPTSWALCGLGKLGGVALGYASDIELLFVYADNGRTDGTASVSNAEFFDSLVRETTASISAKREGVFRIDLRLRPYGRNSPLACSIDNFCRYYGPGGDALSYERLALVRLRAIAGDPTLGARIERLRDQFVYDSASISIPELQQLREKQVATKTAAGRLNAKFSPGALVDIEYCVQMLQVLHGGRHAQLRSPRIHEALNALSEVGVLTAAENERLTRAYYFLRRLINALRMLRGNALDLFLPAADSLEYRHLARRMNYQRRQDFDVGRQLFVDFEINTAVVRRFVARHFGREAVPGSGKGNVVDLILSGSTPDDSASEILEPVGLRRPDRALRNLRGLARLDAGDEHFPRLAVLAVDMLRFTADPDMALNNWERFAGELGDPVAHFEKMLLQPRRLEILLGVFATSQFLADTLVKRPGFIESVVRPDVLQRLYDVSTLKGELDRFVDAGGARSTEERLDAVRRFRRREILRIGIRDLFLKCPVKRVSAELADLAETILDWCTNEAHARLARTVAAPPPLAQFCILAFGKCGGRELNYSSDIDLVGIVDDAQGLDDADRMFFDKLLSTVREDLMGHTAEGFVYRVDFRLRPHGRAGRLAVPCSAAVRYYGSAAAIWEIQALLKARPVAANRALGERLLEQLNAIVAGPHDPRCLASSVRRLRKKSRGRRPGAAVADVKNGQGGIRDVEFLVQALQLAHAQYAPQVLEVGTLDAIQALSASGILEANTADTLTRNYVFLRRVEHFLQILEDRQTHTLPADRQQLDALARRVLGPRKNGNELKDHVQHVMRQIATHFQDGLHAIAELTPRNRT